MDKDYGSRDDRIGAIIASSGYPRAVRSLLRKLDEGDVVASVALGPGRDAVLLAAVAARLQAEPRLRALVIAPSDREVAGLKQAFDRVAGPEGPSSATIGRDVTTEIADAAIGSLDAIASRIAAGTLDPDAFGLVALSDLDPLAGAASVAMLRHALGSGSAERRLVGFAAELRPAHRAVVAPLCDSLVEIELEDEGQRVKDAPASSFATTAEDKPRLLLGLLSRDADRPFAVFCNLKDSAESVARMLRSRGVKTEYVLGNLQRKRAVLDSVVAGEYEALVLTDEGAAGLPGAWAARLVNWDLPLDGEPYLARLGHLNASARGAGVYNFACDRYSLGLPAIERAIGSRLELTRADESLMAPAGTEPSEPSGREAREPSKARPGRENRQARPAEAREPRDRRRAQDRRDRGGQYDGRNIKAIQDDIAAITGGKPSAAPNRARAAQPAARDAEAPSRGKKARGKAAAPARQDGGPSRRASPSRPAKGQAGKSGTGEARPSGKRPRGGSDNRIRDPYSISMEERMRLYRERYAGDAERGDSQRQAPRPAPRPDRGRQAKPSAPAARDEAAAAPKAPEPKTRKPGSDAAPRGVLGALKGLFGKRDG